MPAALVKFRQQYPKINITVHDVINEEVTEMVRSRQVEMGIAFSPEGTGSLLFTPLFEDHFVAVVPPTSKLIQSTQLAWSTLLSHDFITLQRPSMVRRLLEQELRKQHMELPVAFESHQLSTVGRDGGGRPRRERGTFHVHSPDA
ncbi:hypothetical protein HSBAA_31480 [Vreelandella sulfidaeris]|uniref:LysR substrate-binding domain-containing protein n=1 Tax=Vreelandella sulfidaeris TaxID=115553 RepID=A0A455U6T9_9GAMM|nr:hypothetical protein HSBAA_31480 [Halomonas sulfidaeris]